MRKRKKIRCAGCDGRIPSILKELKCKCGKRICRKCVRLKRHKCEFDYFVNSQESLQKSLVAAKFKKVEKI